MVTSVSSLPTHIPLVYCHQVAQILILVASDTLVAFFLLYVWYQLSIEQESVRRDPATLLGSRPMVP
jgi:hypothetical protein